MSFLESYFQLGPIPSDAMQGSYDWHLVLLSYILAVAASYVALDVTERIRASEALRTKMLWLVSGAIAMGCGIWTMHFIGMLAFVMPMPMDYDPWITAFSLLIAVVASGFAFYLIKDQAVKTLPVILGGVIMGIAIVSMHYAGMAAMEGVSIRYLPGLFVASVVIAVITSETALGLMILGSNKIVKQAVPLKISSAMLMGMAICGMHYTGMEAAVFTHIPDQAVASVAPLLHPESLSWAIAGVTALILLIALGVSKYSIYLVQRRNKDLLETEAILEALNRSLTKAVDDLSVKEERIRAILAAAADGILVMDAIGVIESANHAAEAMFHYSAEEMISSQITDFLGLPDPINPDLLQPIAFEEMLQKSDAVVEYVGVSKNAETFPIELSISSSKVGDKTFYIIVCRDIQERKRAEKKVQSLNQQLVHTARLAGMAEVATSVLHNVGNVLNSINVSAKILLGRDMSNKIRGFRALADTLLQNRAALSTFVQQNPVGRALPEYVSQFADFLEDDWKTTHAELESLNDKVHHIKNVVSMQQSLSRGSDIKERCYVNKLVDDAIAIHTESFEKYQINIERQFEAMPELELDKVKTLQILVNLVKNALESIVERNGEEKKITVKTYLSSGFLNIEVIDTGKGILPEDITKVFAYGFTTKKEGHGIGLHSCSLSAQEGGGSLKAYSDGDNKGATFVLCLPAQIYEAKRENEV